MKYLQLTRTQTILGCFLVSSLLLVQFPWIDIRISELFFDGGFYFQGGGWRRLFRDGLGYLLGLSLGSILGLYLFNKLFRRNVLGIDGRKVLYVFLVLILGAGLIVNAVFKESFGRARPRDIAEFGGAQDFTPAWVISEQCDSNCSFSSGEGAAAFFFLAFATALTRKRTAWVVAFAFGSFVSFYRIASGAHFFSDSLVSFFVMLILTDALYYYLIERREGSRRLVVSPAAAPVPET